MKRSNLAHQLIGKYLADYENQLEKSSTNDGGSFVFLDNQTLQMILAYLFTQDGQDKAYDTSLAEAKIDQMILEQKQQLEQIIRKLEEKV
ncbi:hypothetical protein F9U64_11025 [Gracilibacillus oryzae]|uniref:Uncharacterized protein n=1 Tax=Gracilibacillus oryzae TaxID=1672701 RepID=A0A7C8KU48_9BACI|nr:hypothetical protein [Gracilibacillus oryzae]KAB8135793.1 hypothetical protein F9U64_11025 [Gracilibacillus oryzae]